MAETNDRAIVCPYLRGRYSPAPNLEPGDANHCILAASIHLPRTQQMRYCLGGNYEPCSRYQRQTAQALPLYITGVPPTPPPTMPPRPDLPDLPWRSPVVRRVLGWLPIILLGFLLALGWRYQESRLETRTLSRPPLPTAIPTPVSNNVDLFYPATVGPGQQ